MLVITRRLEESFYLILPSDPVDLLALAGQVVEIKVLDSHRIRCTLGVTADRSISINREEPVAKE